MTKSSIAIIVCNYNKRNFVMDCVESLVNQSYAQCDIFVVDNASTDDSVEALSNSYSDKITIIRNEENLGGAGGFDTGLEHCFNLGYEYLLLVDNDTKFDNKAVELLYSYLSSHNSVGMCGATILQMCNPDYIQEMGGKIDFQCFDIAPFYRGENIYSNKDIPDVVNCDFLAACALMVKREVIEKIGIMNRDYFVYWDDIDWCKRCTDAGYELVALKAAHVWHNWSANLVTKFNLFREYYGRRNKLTFFAKYIDENQIETFAEHSLRGIFNVAYGYSIKQAINELNIAMIGWEHFVNGILGKNNELKIKELSVLPLEELVNRDLPIYIGYNELLGPDGGVTSIKEIVNFLSNNKAKIVDDINDCKEYVHLFPCRHILQVVDSIFPRIYVDKFMNCIITEQQYLAAVKADVEYEKFKEKNITPLLEGIIKIRKRNS